METLAPRSGCRGCSMYDFGISKRDASTVLEGGGGGNGGEDNRGGVGVDVFVW